MGLIKLHSAARAASQHNTSTITFNRGKPATIIAAECDGLRDRQEGEKVHLANSADGDGYCLNCGWVLRPHGRTVWTDSEEVWERNAGRCGQ